MQRNSKPIKWTPKGVSDTLDASDAFNGAMSALGNLIPDPSTAMLWQARPAALPRGVIIQGPFSPGFSPGFQVGAPGAFISCMFVVGDVCYGMIAQPTGPLAGKDIPFAFSLTGNILLNVSGVAPDGSNLPVSPPSTGAWTPPQMDIISTKIMVAHSGFNGTAGNFIGWFDISNPVAITWNAGNLTSSGSSFVPFTVAPIAVAQFAGRAYYIHNASQPAVIWSDVLSPLTNGHSANTPVLTFGDAVPLTALGKLPLNNQLGGIIQSLMVFKDSSNIFQITGDDALGNLVVNSLNCACGTASPNSIASTPKGLAFVSNDGLRVIDFNGHVSDPVGQDGKGVCVPFIYSVIPSRISAACNANLLRITTQNGLVANSPTQEYWLDIGRGVWSGPHSCNAALAEPYKQTFIIAPTGLPGVLYQSDYFQNNTSTFVEYGNQMLWTYVTPLLPDSEQITNLCVTESTIDMELPAVAGILSFTFSDQSKVAINSISIQAAGAPSVWGQFQWGKATWGGVAAFLQPFRLPWTTPLVFARGSLSATGQCQQSFKIGAFRMRLQPTKQFTNTLAAA